MNAWWGKGVAIAALLVMIALRAPFANRALAVPVAASRKGALERLLLVLVGIGYFAPIVWAAWPALAFADYALRPAAFAAGVALLVVGLWLFHRSHVDLGTNWSVTLEVREGHRLVTEGVYRRVRHPMYAAILLYGAGQALVASNWIAGPLFLAAFVLMVALRLGPEERMMRETFPAAYDAYAARSARLVPGVW